MADLIIKPSTGGSNTLILQDEGGDAALTIGATGNTTLAGTANNLGTVATMTLPTPSATAIYPEGHILQVKGTNSDATWGPIGHANPWHISNIDVTITTKGLNSDFMIWGRFNADDTNAGTFGMGIGFRYYVSSSEAEIVAPHEHEQYEASSNDKYMVAHHQNFFTGLNVAIGTVIIFRAYGEFNNSNGQQSLGSGRIGQQMTVMEVQS